MGVFFLFIHYSHATYRDHGGIMYSPFPVRCPRGDGMLQAPLCPPPWPVPERCDTRQGNNKERDKGKRQRKDDMKSGVGRSSGDDSLPAPGSTASCPSSHSRSSASDSSLTTSSSAGTCLPTPVEERKSSTARLHLSSARRSRIFHRSFHLPVSFLTFAHRIFCWASHSGQSLKRCSRV